MAGNLQRSFELSGPPGVTLLVYGTGLCHFLGYLFHDSFRIYEYGFQKFSCIFRIYGIVFYQNSFIGELF